MERTDGKDSSVSVPFTVPSDYSSKGKRVFRVTFLPYSEEHQPLTSSPIDIERSFLLTNVRGDTDGNGCVGLTDLTSVADFISRHGTDGSVQQTKDYFRFLQYDINGNGAVDNIDLGIQAENFNKPRCGS